MIRTASLIGSVSRRAGGLFESVRCLHRELANISGVSVRIFALQDNFTNQDLHNWAPLPVETFRAVGPPALGFSPKLRAAILNLNEDILHTHGLWMYPSLVSHHWHRKTRRPYMISPHGMLEPWAVRNSAWKKRLALLLYESAHLRNAACLRALNLSEAASIRAFGLKNPICVVPNGIDLPKNDIQQPPTLLAEAKAAGKKVLLYLGRIHPKKGLENLLRSWAGLHMSQEWILAIAGWDQAGHETKLKRLATELAISWADLRQTGVASPLCPATSLVFLGPQFGDAKSGCYQACDAFILPSLSEGLPMAVLEAWAYGKPVLMTKECNLPEGFDSGAALQIDKDVPGLRQGLDHLIRMGNPERLRMGSLGRDLVQAQFSWPKIARQLHAVYQWILGDGAKPSFILDK